RLLEPYRQLAHEAGCTMAQLALAWLLAQGDDVVPIPGTTSVEHLHENLGAADVELAQDLVARVGAAINQRTVSGPRYAPERAKDIDTEDFE
ncbi:MAG TPA: aldo/keto reductase, partial [Zeimonas sp.]|nr:aldo/keto reductase [Zeimonas sp.]